MRVHLLTTEAPPVLGGVATWAARVAAVLRARGTEVVLWTHLGDGDRHLPGRSWNRWGGAQTALRVWPELRSGDGVLAATWPLAEHLVGRAPLLVGWHGSDLTRPQRVEARAKVAASAVNLPVSEFLGGLLGAPHVWLPYPLARAQRAQRGDALLVVARLTPLKGVDRALHLAARLGRPVRVVGDGPERAALERLAAELAVDATFYGATRDIPWDGTWALALFSRADADGSGQEGLGLVLLEAAARGIPTLGSRCGGIPEAAWAVLDDPERSELPELPTPEAMEAWIFARHGEAAFAAAWERALGELRRRG